MSDSLPSTPIEYDAIVSRRTAVEGGDGDDIETWSSSISRRLRSAPRWLLLTASVLALALLVLFFSTAVNSPFLSHQSQPQLASIELAASSSSSSSASSAAAATGADSEQSMSYTLLLLRHALSSWKHADVLDDFDRPLSATGRESAFLVGCYAAEHFNNAHLGASKEGSGAGTDAAASEAFWKGSGLADRTNVTLSFVCPLEQNVTCHCHRRWDKNLDKSSCRSLSSSVCFVRRVPAAGGVFWKPPHAANARVLGARLPLRFQSV